MEDPVDSQPGAPPQIPNLPARTGRMLPPPIAPTADSAELSPSPPSPPLPPAFLPPPNLPPHACDPPPFAEPLGPSVPLAARFAAASRMLARARMAEGRGARSSDGSGGSGDSAATEQPPQLPPTYRLVYDSLLPSSDSQQPTTTRWDYAPGLRSWCVPPDHDDDPNGDGPNDPPPLVFESRFESGNLRRAVRVGPREYDLVLQPDLNTSSHAQWYFFAVRNGRCGGKGWGKGGGGEGGAGEDAPANPANPKTKTKYRLNIINLLKPDSLYNSGLRPLVHSAARQRREGVGWFRAGEGVAYHATPARAEENGGDEETTTTKKRRAKHQGNNPRHFTLTFEYAFEEDDDLVHFAHCYPYTYTDLQRELHALEREAAALSSASASSSSVPRSPSPAVLCSRQPLCTTLAGNVCDLLTITGPLDQGLPLNQRLGVVLSARVHPGETNASWMMRGALRELLSSSSPSSSSSSSPDAKAANAAALAATASSNARSLLLGRFVFKVAPMLNPDGVACGNYRCSLAGVDLNRVYASPCERAHPTVAALKKAVAAFADERPVVLLADLHGHSRKLGVFAYGCEPDEARKLGLDETTAMTGTTEQQVAPGSRGTVPGVPRRHQARLFPLLLHAAAPDLFSFAACSFRVARSKAGTGRVVAFAELGLANALTIEASFCGPLAPVVVGAADESGGGGNSGGSSGDNSPTAPPRLRRVHFNTSHLERMGQVIVRALLDYVPMKEEEEEGSASAGVGVGAPAAAAEATLAVAAAASAEQQQPHAPAPRCSVRQQMLQQLEVLAEAESVAAQLDKSSSKAGQRRARAAVLPAEAGGDDGSGSSTGASVRLVQTRRGPVLEVVAAGREGELEVEEEEEEDQCTDSEDDDGGGGGHGRGNGPRSSSSSGGEGGGGQRRHRKQARRQQSPAAQRRAALERMRERRRQLVEALGSAVAGRVLEGGGGGGGEEGEDDETPVADAPPATAPTTPAGAAAALQLLLAASSAAVPGTPPTLTLSSSSSPLLLLGELAAFFAASRAAAVAAAAADAGGGSGNGDSALGLLELAAVARPALLRMDSEGSDDAAAATGVEADARAAATATNAAVAAVTAVRRAADTAAAELARARPCKRAVKSDGGGAGAGVGAGPATGVAKKKKKRNNKHRGGAKQRLKREERAAAAAAAEATAAAADPVLLQERARAEAGLAVALQKRGE